jgi:hypothetical protein
MGTEEHPADAVLIAIQREAAGVASGSADPYGTALQLMGKATDGLTEHTWHGERCNDLYLIFAGLTDRYELGPVAERDRAQRTIRRFVEEWLDAADKPRVEEVLGRWRYEELGDERSV